MTQQPGSVVCSARALVRESLDLPDLLDEIADGDDLLAAGVNSGEMILVALRCEQLLGRSLDDDELASITSVSAIAQLLLEAAS